MFVELEISSSEEVLHVWCLRPLLFFTGGGDLGAFNFERARRRLWETAHGAREESESCTTSFDQEGGLIGGVMFHSVTARRPRAGLLFCSSACWLVGSRVCPPARWIGHAFVRTSVVCSLVFLPVHSRARPHARSPNAERFKKMFWNCIASYLDVPECNLFVGLFPNALFQYVFMKRPLAGFFFTKATCVWKCFVRRPPSISNPYEMLRQGPYQRACYKLLVCFSSSRSQRVWLGETSFSPHILNWSRMLQAWMVERRAQRGRSK